MAQPNTAEREPTLVEPDEMRRQILSDWKADIDAKRQKWQRLLSEADEQIASIDVLLEGLPSEQNHQMPLAHTDPETPELVSGKATVKDIMHCETQEECARVIAKINGTVYLGSASKLIEAAGKGKSARTVLGTLHSRLSSSDDWEKVVPNTFRLVDTSEDSEGD